MQNRQKPTDLLDQLRNFPLFKAVEEEALKWLIERGEYLTHPKDTYLFRSGEPVDYMQILLRGSYVIRREKDGRKREIGVWEAPNVTGVLPFSRMTSASADAFILEDIEVLQIHKNCFTEMVNVNYGLVQILVSVMTDRVRDFQQIRLMDEKLMALGKMSAGLAHELNNPASAMVRSSQELQKHLGATPERFKEIVTMRVDRDMVDKINAVLFERIKSRGAGDELSLMEREELSDDLTDWFEDNDIDDAEEIIDTLIDWNFQPQHLDQITEAVPEQAVPSMLWWIEASLTTEGLVGEIQTASTRIADLISSIKTYSHMDSEPSMEYIDVHNGIKSTLTMLKFKFKKKNVSLDKTCNYNLPNIKALEGELNQVWTNLITNALDALPDDGTGKITIRSYQQRDKLCIEIEDNGLGIPEDIKSRIFEPFFTTKGIGEGTGMGLDIVRKVLQRHGGTVGVESEPGKTCFRVCFPL